MTNAKMHFYSNIIDEHKNNQEVIFSTVDKMLHLTPEKFYPTCNSAEELANKFSDFFVNKITKIRSEMSSVHLPDPNIDLTDAYNDNPIVEFSKFSLVTEDELARLLWATVSKSCELDPIPAPVLKKCFHVLLPIITKTVNLSLSNNVMPLSLKLAVLNPCLKKPSLDHEEFPNFRPISNLKVVSKAIEKTVASQFIEHIHQSNLDEIYQSAYKAYHSTETALVRVQNDVLLAIDNNQSVILLLLDLSAAFDTVDHRILISRLSNRFGLKGDALDWFRSYLSDRKQFVSVNGNHSTIHDLHFGIPQGSVLGPILFLCYTSPLADVIRKHGMSFHLYADDTQIYISFKSSMADEAHLAILKIEACIRDVDQWLSFNMLKMNRDKTELLVLNARHRPPSPVTSVLIYDEVIQPTPMARNIGVTFDSFMSMEQHVNATCKSAFYGLRNLSKIRRYISRQSAEVLVHAFVTSKLDFCNALFYGLPNHLIQKLQSVQNSAARLTTFSHKYDHITPILKELHWLPVKYRIEFKVLLLTFKCINKTAPAYLQDLIHQYVPERYLRSGSKNYLETKHYNLQTYGYRAFSVAAPILWNKLPDNIRVPGISVETFKNKLKTHLFRKAFLA